MQECKESKQLNRNLNKLPKKITRSDSEKLIMLNW